MSKHCIRNWLFFLLAALATCPVIAQTAYVDNFTKGKASLKWLALDDACLTAGTQSGTSSLSNPIIPSCASKNIDVRADAQIAGQGALLLTTAQDMQTGAILSAFPPFPLSQGIQITFTTYTFGGDNGGTAGNGADGIVFFLTDGTKPAPTQAGGSGGSMGYGCSNGNPKAGGMRYGYLGLGVDEFGNFLNSGDNGSTGIYNSRNSTYGTTAHGDNTYQNNVDGGITAGSGAQYQPERIGLRGRGNTNWIWLHKQNPDYYGSYDAGIMQRVCKHAEYVSSGTDGNDNLKDIPFNYNVIPGGYAVLPDSQPIANNHDDATRNPTATTPTDEIAWPITYRLTISPAGLLNFAYSYNDGTFQPVLANKDITASNGTLPASLRFGFSAGTGGDTNIHELTCFKAAPLQANSSVGANTQRGHKVTGHTQFFLPAYSTNNWWGSMVAVPLVTNNGTLAVSTVANWDAKCVLTGGPCATMGTDANGNPEHNVTVEAPSTRVLLTSSAGGSDNGVPLEWANLGTAAQSALNKDKNGTVDNKGSLRVKWLRGDRAVEQLHQPTPGDLRARTYVLGDIIDSSPAFVGAPVLGTKPNAFADLLYPSASNPENAGGATTYSSFATAHASRENVVYIGANDGFVHGFRAGSYQSGVYDVTTNDGKEVMGYVPYGVLMNKVVNLADPMYVHDYLVDATPAAGDVFYNKTWHTWLVGGVGSNGREMYALDITNPSNFSQSNASSLVVGDWNSTTLTHLGHTVGTPIIQRMHNGDWAFIFGNGLDSGTSAGVYIGLIDPSTGSVSFKFLDTGVSSDGIAYVSSVDLDGDDIADYLYAGDTQGNVWRFNVTSNDATQWAVSTFGNATGTPLFVAKDASGNRQPITTAITALAVETGTKTRVMLYFGTGRQVQQTVAQGRQYAKGQQTFYGIWDWGMSTWDGLSQTDYAALSGTQSITRDHLLAQSVVTESAGGTNPAITGYRTLATDNVVCWKGDATGTACPTTDEYGWMFDLPGQGPTTGANAGENEQIVYSPTFVGGAVVVNTVIPPIISAHQCNPGLQTGWTMAFNPKTGGGLLPQGFFPGPNGGFGGGGSNNATTSGVKMGGVGTPTTVQHGGKTYLITQTVPGTPALIPVNPHVPGNPARVSWRELVNP